VLEIVELAIALPEVDQELRLGHEVMPGGELAQRVRVVSQVVERAPGLEVRARPGEVVGARSLSVRYSAHRQRHHHRPGVSPAANRVDLTPAYFITFRAAPSCF